MYERKDIPSMNDLGCEHEWVKRESRGHSYVCCSLCHYVPDPMTPYRALASVTAERDAALRDLRTLADDPQARGGVVFAFRVLHEALCAGGYSASRIVERLNEHGFAISIGHLHSHGLQDIANALSDAASGSKEKGDG